MLTAQKTAKQRNQPDHLSQLWHPFGRHLEVERIGCRPLPASRTADPPNSVRDRPRRISRLMRQACTMYSAGTVSIRLTFPSCKASIRRSSFRIRMNSSISQRARYYSISSSTSSRLWTGRLLSSRQTIGLLPSAASISSASTRSPAACSSCNDAAPSSWRRCVA